MNLLISIGGMTYVYNEFMRILFAVWELAPFLKVGGLGDVAHFLPKEIKNQEEDIRVVTPFYKALRTGRQKRVKVDSFVVWYGGRNVKIDVYQIKFLDADVPVYLLRNRKYLDVPGKDTFAVFGLSVARLVQYGVEGWKPEIVHGNDHHCGLLALVLRAWKVPVKFLLTIHSMMEQGKRGKNLIAKMNLEERWFHLVGWELKDRRINSLLEGIKWADVVNTVSPTYAREIRSEEYGAGLDDILRQEESKITGIVNGIDYGEFSPEVDKTLGQNYGVDNWEEGKYRNKLHFQRKWNLRVNSSIPMIGFGGRLASKQKGVDLLHKMMLRMNLSKFQFVIVGQGEEEWEEKFGLLGDFYPKSVYFAGKFSDEVERQMYAACDVVLCPSRYEPCGLTQMKGMRYGCLPVARATGGLIDTIEDGVDGFLFEKLLSVDMEGGLKRALQIRKDRPEEWGRMVRTAMKKDFSWKRSAQKYLEVYQRILR